MSSLRNSHILSFSRRRDRTSEQTSGQAKECAWSDEKTRRKWTGRIRLQFRSHLRAIWKRVLRKPNRWMKSVDYSLIIVDDR